MTDLINEKAKPSQDEQRPQLLEKEVVLKSGETVKLPYIHIDQMRFFRGSQISGISEFTDAEETTIGNGLYLTPDRNIAADYSIVRSLDPKNRFVYEVEINNMNILDLKTKNAIDNFAKLMRQKLAEKQGTIKADSEIVRQWTEDKIAKTISDLDSNNYLYLRDITKGFGDLVRSTLSKLGYQGLVALESGEGGNGIEKMEDHESFVIFDPKKANIIKEEPVQQSTAA